MDGRGVPLAGRMVSVKPGDAGACEGGRSQPHVATIANAVASSATTLQATRFFEAGEIGREVSRSAARRSRVSPIACSLSLRSFFKQYSRSLRARSGCMGRQRVPLRVELQDHRQRVRDRFTGEGSACHSANSNSTAPNDQISERRSAVLPRACSGAMYAAVPRITPMLVDPAVSVGELEGSASGMSRPSMALPSPKSSSLTVPSGVTLIFAGLRSRWIMPRSGARIRAHRRFGKRSSVHRPTR